MPVNVDDIVEAVYTELSVAGGVNTQVYGDDKMLLKLQHKFDVLFDRLWWPQFMVYGESMPLDGTTGEVTTTLTSKIKRWYDLQAVFHENDPYALSKMPHNVNIANMRRRCIAPTNNDKIFKVIPITTTGNVYVNYRTKPADMVYGGTIEFDKMLLVHGVCADALINDGVNPDDAEKYNRMFAERFAEFARQDHNHSIPLDQYNSGIPTEWQ